MESLSVTKRTRNDLDYEWTPEYTDVSMGEDDFFALIDSAEDEGWRAHPSNPIYPGVYQFERYDDATNLYDFLQISFDPYQ